MSGNTEFASLPQTLHEFWLLWLSTLRSDGMVLPDGQRATNADRSPSDRLNYKRALKDFAQESTGAENLKEAPLTLLALEEDRILDTMIRGTTSRKGMAPSKHLEGSLRSWMRRLLTDMAFCLAHKSLRPQPGHKLWKPYRTPLKPFPTANWPENLSQEFDVLESNYANRFYAGPGRDALKRHRMRPNTWKNYRRAVNRIVEYCLTVEHL